MSAAYLYLFRLVLSAAPASFRERYGHDAVMMARERLAAGGSLRFALRELFDLIRTVIREWRLERARTAAALPARRLRTWPADLRMAMRGLRHQPVQVALVIMVLGIGLGSTTAMFSVVDAVLLRPLPYPHGRALVRITEVEPARNLTGASFPALAEWSQLPSLAGIGAMTSAQLLFQGGAAPERPRGMSVSPGFFDVLGVQPQLGRLIQPGDPLLDAQAKIVLSHGLWQRQFAGDRGVVGRVVTLEARPYTIVGVTPPGFAFPDEAEFWTSFTSDMQRVSTARSLRFLDVVGRLASGRSLEDLRAELAAWQGRTVPLLAAKDHREVRAVGVHEEMVAGVRPALRIAMTAVGLLLLAAAANAAALMFARSRARSMTLVVHSALGASRGRLIRQQCFEASFIAGGGALLALVVAAASRAGIVALSIDQIPRIASLAVDTRVILFTIGCSVVVTMLAALGPALALSPVAHESFRHATHRVAGSRASRRIFGALVTAECAFAVALVAGAVLLASSYSRLRAVGTGVDPAGIGVVSVNVPLTPDWRSEDRIQSLLNQLRLGVSGLPGVTHVALAGRLPLDSTRGGIEIKTDDPGVRIPAVYTIASDGYLSTVGARIVAGRDLAITDTATAPPVAVINDVLARRLFGEPDRAIGRRASFDFMRGPVTLEVVGVVAAIRYDGLRSELKPELFQHPQQTVVTPGTLVFRTTADPLSLTPAIRSVLAGVEPTGTVTLERWSSLEARMARATAQPRFFLVLTGVFAASAALLAAFGIYGTLSNWIAERRKELGIRMALGADRRALATLVLTRGLWLSSAGALLGVVISLVSARALSRVLFEVSSTDPALLLLAAGSLIVISGLASLVPARRAMRVNPLDTLR